MSDKRVEHTFGSVRTGRYLTTVFSHERGASCDICRVRLYVSVLAGAVLGILTADVLLWVLG